MSETVTWWGRVRSASAQHHGGRWITEEFPADQTPYTHEPPHWQPVDIWLPHPPVRGRRR